MLASTTATYLAATNIFVPAVPIPEDEDALTVEEETAFKAEAIMIGMLTAEEARETKADRFRQFAFVIWTDNPDFKA